MSGLDGMVKKFGESNWYLVTGRKISVMPENIKCEDVNAMLALESEEYFETLKNYDKELKELTEKIWETEYLKSEPVCVG